MQPAQEILRFIYKTEGVCPPEIHLKIQADVLKTVRFVGGGCPGNALLVSRLLQDKPLSEVMSVIEGIVCRNDTSCADQLSRALVAVETGRLAPARSFQVHTDSRDHRRVGLIGALDGRKAVLEQLLPALRQRGLDDVYCLGGLTGGHSQNQALLRFLKQEEIPAIAGQQDWRYAQGEENESLPPLPQRERDFLLRLPQVLSFQIGARPGVAFFGDYLQSLPGYSDFEPFALEMNMICGLTQFMQDETVFPALEAMIPQFEAQVAIFSQMHQWGHWQLAETDFISVGPAAEKNTLTWGLLEAKAGQIHFETIQEDF